MTILRCTGCGSTDTIEKIRADNPRAVSCCPERDMQPFTYQDALDRIAELEASFDLRWKADMRAIEKWRELTGRNLTWPDHADLCVWLLEQIEETRQQFTKAVNGWKQALSMLRAVKGDMDFAIGEINALRPAIKPDPDKARQYAKAVADLNMIANYIAAMANVPWSS